jgi:hypothetical protein
VPLAASHEPVSCADAANGAAKSSFELAIEEPATPNAMAFVEALREERPDIAVVFHAMQDPSAVPRRLELGAYLAKPASSPRSQPRLATR